MFNMKAETSKLCDNSVVCLPWQCRRTYPKAAVWFWTLANSSPQSTWDANGVNKERINWGGLLDRFNSMRFFSKPNQSLSGSLSAENKVEEYGRIVDDVWNIWWFGSKMLRVLQPLNVTIYTLFAEGALLRASPDGEFQDSLLFCTWRILLLMSGCILEVTSQDMLCPLPGIWWGLQSLVLQI